MKANICDPFQELNTDKGLMQLIESIQTCSDEDRNSTHFKTWRLDFLFVHECDLKRLSMSAEVSGGGLSQGFQPLYTAQACFVCVCVCAYSPFSLACMIVLYLTGKHYVRTQ